MYLFSYSWKFRLTHSSPALYKSSRLSAQLGRTAPRREHHFPARWRTARPRAQYMRRRPLRGSCAGSACALPRPPYERYRLPVLIQERERQMRRLVGGVCDNDGFVSGDHVHALGRQLCVRKDPDSFAVIHPCVLPASAASLWSHCSARPAAVSNTAPISFRRSISKPNSRQAFSPQPSMMIGSGMTVLTP